MAARRGKQSTVDHLPVINANAYKPNNLSNESEAVSATSPAEQPQAERKLTIWTEFILVTSFHGFHEAYVAPNKLWRLFWILMIIVGVGASGYEIYKIVSQYISHPVTTAVTREFKQTLEVPDITVCFPQRVNWTLVNETMGVTKDVLEYMNGVFMANYPSNYLSVDNATLHKLEQEYRKLKQNLNLANIEQFYEQGTLTCEKMFRNCVFGGLPLEGHCCDHIQAVTTTHGACFKVSATRNNLPVVQHFGGPNGGFMLVMQTQPESQPKTFFNSFHDDGLFIYIGDKQNRGNPVPFDAGVIMIPSGTHAYVSLETRRFINIVGHGCRLPQPQLAYFNGYNKQTCLYECTLNSTLKHCGCISPGFNVTNNLPKGIAVCDPYLAHTCVNPHLFGYQSTKNTGKVNVSQYYSHLLNCENKCDYVCDYIEYEPKVMYTKYPPEGMEATFKYHYKLDADDDVDNRFILVEIFFSHIAEMVTKEVKTSSMNGLIGNIGGQIGLFMGASLMTLVHAIVFWFGYTCCGNPKQGGADYQ